MHWTLLVAAATAAVVVVYLEPGGVVSCDGWCSVAGRREEGPAAATHAPCTAARIGPSYGDFGVALDGRPSARPNDLYIHLSEFRVRAFSQLFSRHCH